MSPVFHQSQASKNEVTDRFQLNHGRYAPTTCLVVTFLDEVNKAKMSEIGQITSRNLSRATLVYNEYASPEGKYFPHDILAKPFILKHNARVDDFLMNETERILDNLGRA